MEHRTIQPPPSDWMKESHANGIVEHFRKEFPRGKCSYTVEKNKTGKDCFSFDLKAPDTADIEKMLQRFWECIDYFEPKEDGED